jgi:hypothetical protein
VWRWHCAAGAAPPSNHHPHQAPGLKQPPLCMEMRACVHMCVKASPDTRPASRFAYNLLCSQRLDTRMSWARAHRTHTSIHTTPSAHCSLDSHEKEVHTQTCTLMLASTGSPHPGCTVTVCTCRVEPAWTSPLQVPIKRTASLSTHHTTSASLHHLFHQIAGFPLRLPPSPPQSNSRALLPSRRLTVAYDALGRR